MKAHQILYEYTLYLSIDMPPISDNWYTLSPAYSTELAIHVGLSQWIEAGAFALNPRAAWCLGEIK